MDFSGLPFPAFRTNDATTTGGGGGGVPPLLQPFLNAVTTNGNASSNVSLDALRNAAAVAAAAAIGTSNSTPNPFQAIVPTTPFALPLSHQQQQQHHQLLQHHHHHPHHPQRSSTPQLPMHTNPSSQITSDLLYTQSASSSLFPHSSFHQQSRFTVSSSSYGTPNLFAHHPQQQQNQQTAQQQYELLQQNAQDALVAAYLNAAKSATLSETKSVADLPVVTNKDKKVNKQQQNHPQKNHHHQPPPAPPAQQSVAGNMFANLSQSPSNGAPNPFAGVDVTTGSSAQTAAQIQNDLSLWYSSLAQTLAAQMYFNSAMKAVADNTPTLTDSGVLGLSLGQIPQLSQTSSSSPSPLSSLYPQLLAMAIQNANNTQSPQPQPTLSHHQHHPTLTFNEQNHKSIEQPIALLSPNNPRYHQPLPELKINSCDSTRTDSDRKKFSPDSSTAALYSPMHSPNSIDFKPDPASQAASRARCTSLYSPTPLRPKLLSSTHSVHDQLPTDLVSKVLQASGNKIVSNNNNNNTMSMGGRVSRNSGRKAPTKSARVKPIQRQGPDAIVRSQTSPVTSNAKLAQLESVAKQLSSKTVNSSTPPLNKSIKEDPYERISYPDHNLQDLKPQLNLLSLHSLPSKLDQQQQQPKLSSQSPPSHLSSSLLPPSISISPVKKLSFGNLDSSLFSSTPNPSTDTLPMLSSSQPIVNSQPFAGMMINGGDGGGGQDLTSTQSPVVSSTKHSNVDQQQNYSSPDFSNSLLTNRSSPHSLSSPLVPRLISPESPGSCLHRPSLSPISQHSSHSLSIRPQRNVPPKKNFHLPSSALHTSNNNNNNSLYWMSGSIEDSSSLLSPPSSNSPQLDTSAAARNALVEQAIQACMSDEDELSIDVDQNAEKSSSLLSTGQETKIVLDPDEESRKLIIDEPMMETISGIQQQLRQPSPTVVAFPCINETTTNPLTSFAATQETKKPIDDDDGDDDDQAVVEPVPVVANEMTNGYVPPSFSSSSSHFDQPSLKLSIRRNQCHDNWSTKGRRKTKRNKRLRNNSQCSSTGSSVGVPTTSTSGNETTTTLIRRHSTDEMLLSKSNTNGDGGNHAEDDPKPELRLRCETYPREVPTQDTSGSLRSGKRSSRKREMAAQLNPWSIRRSERIFLHAAYQTHTNSNDSSPGAFNLILTSNRKLQKDAAAAAAATSTVTSMHATTSSSADGSMDACNVVSSFGNLSQNLSNNLSSGMFSGSVSLMSGGSFANEKEMEAECELLKSIVWTREDRLPKASEFRLHAKQLQVQRQRILLRSDELLYAGHTEYECPTDEKSVLVRLDGESNDRRMSLQQLLGQAIREYRPTTMQQLTEGTRVCAYWSNRARCLYPGRVIKLLPNNGCTSVSSGHTNLSTNDRRDLILVEFDDGDKGRIALNEIRLLPAQFSVDNCVAMNESEIESSSCLPPPSSSSSSSTSVGAHSPSASSERVGESSIRIRLNSGSESLATKRSKHGKEHHKRRKHHHHHSKRRRHKKKSKAKKTMNGDDNNSDTDIVDNDEDEDEESETGRLTTTSSTSPSVGDESEDPSSDSEDDDDDDGEDYGDNEEEEKNGKSHHHRKNSRDNVIRLNGNRRTSSSSQMDEGNDSQWVCEVNNSSSSSRSLRHSSPNQTTCKAVIRRKRPSKSTSSSSTTRTTTESGGRRSSKQSKIAAFLPDRQLWSWHGEPNQSLRKGYRPKKLFYDAIIRGDEIIRVKDCAVFLSTGRPSLPFVGRVVSLWQSPNGNMSVRVRWFYHPEETKTQPKLLDSKGALFESQHFDNNDVQTISHKCLVLPYRNYVEEKQRQARLEEQVTKKQDEEQEDEDDEDDPPNIYYFSGLYDPLSGHISIDCEVPFKDT